MKIKLTLSLLLLFILNLDGVVLAEKANGSLAFSADGMVASVQQRRKKRRARRKPRTYAVKTMPDEPGSPEPVPEGAAAPPAPAEEPPTQTAPPPPPVMAAPAPAPKKSAPRIKPPTVSIKPPTR